MKIKLNLGSKLHRIEGFKNVDIDPKCLPDFVMDVSCLEFQDSSIDEIYAGHLLEHFDCSEKVMIEWYRVLKTGGKLTVTVPDVMKGIEEYKIGKIDRRKLNQIVFANWHRDKQTHHQIMYTELLIKLFKDVGFKNVIEIPDSPYLSGRPTWQTIVEGVK